MLPAGVDRALFKRSFWTSALKLALRSVQGRVFWLVSTVGGVWLSFGEKSGEPMEATSRITEACRPWMGLGDDTEGLGRVGSTT